MEGTIYNGSQLCGSIVLDFCINVHRYFAILMTGKILYRLGINSGINQICNVCMPKLMRRYLEVKTVNDISVMGSFLAQSTAEATGWSCEITETLADNATVMATVVIHGGDKYIVVPTDAGPGDLVGIIGIPEHKTLGDYAAEKGKTLLFVGASITKVGDIEGINGSQRMENIADNEMVILSQTEQTVDTSNPDAICTVYAREDGKKDVERIELPFTLNTAPTVSGEMIFHPLKPDAIPGLTVGDLHITETALGYNVLMPETVTDWDKRYEIMKVEIEGLDNAVGASVQHDDGNWYFEVNMCQGTVGDILIIHYYDWDKQPIGEIEFRKQIG